MAERILYLEGVVGSLGSLEEEGDMDDADVVVGAGACACYACCIWSLLGRNLHWIAGQALSSA
jgi:hypothetical protein